MTNQVAPEAVPEVIAEVPPVKELSMIEKAKLISDLASAFQDPEIITVLEKRNNGKRIRELFEGALNDEMASVMSGEADKKMPPVAQLHQRVEAMANAMSNFHQMISSFLSSPLVQVLDMMNRNLGGSQNNQPMPQPQPYPHGQVYPQSQSPQVSPQQPQQQSQRSATQTVTRGSAANSAGFF
jgi:hypothetical protein